MKGIARNTPECRRWLEAQPGVTNIRELSADVLMFEHDGKAMDPASFEVGQFAVYFDLAAAPF